MREDNGNGEKWTMENERRRKREKNRSRVSEGEEKKERSEGAWGGREETERK